MTSCTMKGKPVVFQAAWLLMTRPMDFLSTLREYALFLFAWILRQCIPFWGGRVELAPNVRLQKNRSLRAEAPGASIVIGRDSIIYEHALLEALGTGTIQVGEGAVLGDIRIASRASVTIGKRCLSSWNVFIQDYDPHPLDPALRKLQVEQMTASFRPSFSQMKKSENTQALKSWSFPSQDIVLGDDVWIGSNVTILKGARIGSGSVIAAGAVVVRGLYPERSLLAGNPARVIREVSPS